MSLSVLLTKLGLSESNGLYFLSTNEWRKKANLSIRTEDNLLELNPDAFFCINNEPLILFFENPTNTGELFRKCWNFNQSPVVIIINGNQEYIYNGFNYDKEIKGLQILSENIKDFEYFKIITGETWKVYQNKLENRNRVDTKLLQNVEATRTLLIKDFNLHPKIANYLIGRIIFTRYLIDRKVELNKYSILSKEDLYTILTSKQKAYSFFKNLKKDFNGNLFPLNYEINNKIIDEEDFVGKEELNVVINLLKGNEISSGQLSMFDIYDFSIIPIEFVSNIYEKFIGKTEQASKGAYYTPLFLVDYIQKETVSKFFESNPLEFNCKVLDPACGSGIFLVETLRQIISQYQKLNPKWGKNIETYKEKLKQLLLDNIFGIDKDENAISVAIFSLYITLLDYLEPSSIVNFQFPPLLQSNFFVDDFFDLKAEYNTLLKKYHFQFILGNPPWGKVEESVILYESYWKEREKNEGLQIKVTNKEIAQVFLIRVSDFSFKECALIVTSKILYLLDATIYRQYFLSKFKIKSVFELSSVRHQIFDKSNDKAVAPATILFYSNSSSIEESKQNLITHISLKPNLFFEIFKLMVIEKYDYKEILQSFFINYDWIWKVLVYGNILDFYLIKRLKNNKNFPPISSIITDESKYIKGQGLKFKDGNNTKKTRHLIGKNFINVNNKKNYKEVVEQYYITSQEKWNLNSVGYLPDDERIFEAPALLITGGINNEFKSISGIMYEDSVFKSSLTAIKALNKNNLSELKSISAILNSSFFSYYIIQIGSSAGIEREETHDSEKWMTPFVTTKKIVELVNDIEAFIKKNKKSLLIKPDALMNIQKAECAIDREIYSAFELSKQEKSLIEYSNYISIPLIKGKETNKIFKKLIYNDSLLKKYAQVFIAHYNNIYNSKGNYFEVEILYSEHTIGMFFKIIPKPSKFDYQIKWNKSDFNGILSTFTNLSFNNISQDLFIQKDIKGFEKDGFYIIKPNQYKCWHEALAYLDLSEFNEAIHKSKSSMNG